MTVSGEDPPDQQGRSDRQFTRDPAIGNIIGRARSEGPLSGPIAFFGFTPLPFFVAAWGLAAS